MVRAKRAISIRAGDNSERVVLKVGDPVPTEVLDEHGDMLVSFGVIDKVPARQSSRSSVATDAATAPAADISDTPPACLSRDGDGASPVGNGGAQFHKPKRGKEK